MHFLAGAKAEESDEGEWAAEKNAAILPAYCDGQ